MWEWKLSKRMESQCRRQSTWDLWFLIQCETIDKSYFFQQVGSKAEAFLGYYSNPEYRRKAVYKKVIIMMDHRIKEFNVSKEEIEL